MNKNRIYHGSNVIVEKPRIMLNGHYKDFMEGNISNAAFWELVKFKYPTHQIVFCTESALETLCFEGSVRL